ncbi:MAG: hypothetical protein MI919_10290 [Holophagales bacterium]|nr:hypothetical protein [Holophagales bacterium]
MDSSSIVVLGFWLALPWIGSAAIEFCAARWLYRRFLRDPLITIALTSCCGIAVVSLPIVALAEAGLYDALALGTVGWAVTAAAISRLAVLSLRRPRRWLRVGMGCLAPSRLLLVGALGIFAFLAWQYPANSLHGILDQGVYANTGLYLAEHGGLKVSYPWQATTEYVRGFLEFTGLKGRGAHMEFQFAHLYPTWIALTAGVSGIEGALRSNGIFILLAAPCFFSLARRFAGEWLALGATVVLLLNPSQVWISRTTLSEPLAQLLIVAGLLLLTEALALGNAALGRLAGLVAGLVGLARLDGLLVATFLILGFVGLRVLSDDDGRDVAVWRACVQTVVPVFGIALVFYFAFSSGYLRDLYWPVVQIAAGTLLALYLAAAMVPVLRRLLRPTAVRQGLAGLVLLGLIVTAAWAYWIRPVSFDEGEVRTASTESGGGQNAASSEAIPRTWSMVHLGTYLTPGVLFLAVLGLAGAAASATTRGPGLKLLPCLVIFGGYSILYLYDPLVHPMHFWAIRRFVPAIAPGTVFFAAVAFAWLVHRLPPRPRALTVGAGIVLCLGALWQTARHYYFVEQNPAIVDQLRDASRRLPADEMILLPIRRSDWNSWSTPLFVTFGHRIVPVNEASRFGAAGLARWWGSEHRRGRSVWLLFTGDTVPENWPEVEAVDSFTFERYFFKPTLQPLPDELRRVKRRVTLYRSDPPSAPTGPAAGTPSQADGPGL